MHQVQNKSQAIGSSVVRTMMPATIIAKAPRNEPSLLLHTTPNTPWALVFETAASTFILSRPFGGAIHLGYRCVVPLSAFYLPCCSAYQYL
jgi:hypothetical protein